MSVQEQIEAALQRTGTIIFQALRDAEGVSQVVVTQASFIEAKVIIDGIPVRVMVGP